VIVGVTVGVVVIVGVTVGVTVSVGVGVGDGQGLSTIHGPHALSPPYHVTGVTALAGPGTV
jgi:hypothetical protein